MHAHDPARPHARIVAALLGLAIFMGSLLLVAIPFAWLWLLAQLGQPYMAVYFLALVGCPMMMIVWGVTLIRLNRLYSRVSESGDEAMQLLEVSVAVTVVIGVAIMVAWLVLFPHSGGPVRGPWP